ncbi:MAG: FAD-dependent oxidoreductase [Muribaculaceae bacterium]
MKHVIIGGVAGGATAAARIRRADENAQIIMLEKGKYISYANCGLPYYIGNVITDRSRLFVQTPADFAKRFNIDVRIENEVIAINPTDKSITIRRKDDTTYNESYDKLLLSPGANPVKPPLKGIDSEGIFTLRNVTDTDNIKEYISSHNVKRATIVGAGFIGLEMAENIYANGATVSIVELGNQVMAPIDFSMAQYVHKHLIDKGVNLYLEKGVESFTKDGETIKVILNDGSSIDSDMVILSIGVRPETSLAKMAGIKIGEAGGIYVNEYLQTSDSDIYAVGDAIEFPNPITGKSWLNYLANPANRQGRIVADNMVMGNTLKYEGAIGTSIAKVFDITVASTGLPAKRLKQFGIEYASSFTQSASHAGYYPNALPLNIKLTFDPKSGKLYGAQCIGYDGVDKRIDQIALLIKRGGTVNDLTMIEHTYAPPFSSAKDPIAIAGYVASNIVSGVMPVVYWRDFINIDFNKILLLDVRTAAEFSFGAIDGAINIPLDDLRERFNELPRNKEIYIYCAVGLRGYLAQRILFANGFTNTKNLSGGYITFTTAIFHPTLAGYCKTNTENTNMPIMNTKTLKIDACGLSCPGPIIKVKQAIDTICDGENLEIISTDAGFARDASSWCNSTCNTLISINEQQGRFTVVIQKGGKQSSCCSTTQSTTQKNKTFIMFSDDLDKALATFVLANGALAMGAKVTIFFTFWGLNVIKKVSKPSVKKDIFGRMFSMMLPSSSLKLSLSKMSMFGIGDAMMRHIMKRKNIESLESLRTQAIAQGAEFIACQMSMDVMGIKKEEMLDNVTIGGVATYLERADNANVNLFI